MRGIKGVVSRCGRVCASARDSPMAAKQAKSDKPNILVIWGDDIGVHNVSAYHRGLMGG